MKNRSITRRRRRRSNPDTADQIVTWTLVPIIFSLMLLALGLHCGALEANAQSRDTTIATWNMSWLGDGPDDRKPRDRDDIQAFKHVVDQMGDVDVIALQEIENEAAIWRVFNPADWEAHVSTRRVNRGWEQRTAILVRRHVGLTATRNPDITTLSPRGYNRHGVDVTLSTGLRIVSIHLKAACPRQNLSSSKACRTLGSQLATLRDVATQSNEPLIIAGDWNRWLESSDVPNHVATAPPLDASPACRGGKYPRFVDYIVSFGSQLKGFAELSTLPTTSDHCPVIATITQ